MKIKVLLIQKQNLVWWGPNIITNTHTDNIILANTQVVHSLMVPQNTAASKYY